MRARVSKFFNGNGGTVAKYVAVFVFGVLSTYFTFFRGMEKEFSELTGTVRVLNSKFDIHVNDHKKIDREIERIHGRIDRISTPKLEEYEEISEEYGVHARAYLVFMDAWAERIDEELALRKGGFYAERYD